MARTSGWSEDELERQARRLSAIIQKSWREIARMIEAILAKLTDITPQDAAQIVLEWHKAVDSGIAGFITDTYMSSAAQVLLALDAPNDMLIGEDLAQVHLVEATNRLKGIADDVWEVVREQIIIGQQNGETIGEIAERVRNVTGVSEGRSLRIARTEVHSALESASYEQAKFVDPNATKIWLATADTRTRLSHRNADNQKVKIGETFSVGEAQLRFPGDPLGPPGEIINCRCSTIYDFDDIILDMEDKMTGELQGQEAELVAAGLKKWKPHLHPRGADGKFIKKGALADFFKKSKPTIIDVSKATNELTPDQWKKLTQEQKDYLFESVNKIPSGTDTHKKLASKIAEVSTSAPSNDLLDKNGKQILPGTKLHDALTKSDYDFWDGINGMDQKDWNKLTNAQKSKLATRVYDFEDDANWESKKAIDNVEKFLAVSPITDVDDAPVVVSIPKQVSKAAPIVDTPKQPEIKIPAGLKGKPGDSAKITTTVIWGKHQPGDVIVKSKDGEERLVWDGKKYRKQIKAAGTADKWLTVDEWTKKDAYANLKNDKHWVIPDDNVLDGDAPTPAVPAPTQAATVSAPKSTASSTPSLSQMHDWSDTIKTGGQKGSNKGGTYTDSDGNKWYLKQPKTPKHASNEVAASALYNLAGIDTPQVVKGNGAPGLTGLQSGTKMVPGAESDLWEKLKDPEYKKAVQDGFVIDAWLANWDVAGMSYDNIVTGADGKPHRIDVGGALLYRAQGTPKGNAFGDEVTELDTLRDTYVNPQSAQLFKDMTDTDIRMAAKRLEAISEADIDKIIKDSGLPSSVATTLKNRRQYILDKYPPLDAPAETPNVNLPDAGQDLKAPSAPSKPKTDLVDKYNKGLLSQDEMIDALKMKVYQDKELTGQEALELINNVDADTWNTFSEADHEKIQTTLVNEVDLSKWSYNFNKLVDNAALSKSSTRSSDKSVELNSMLDGGDYTPGELLVAVSDFDKSDWDGLTDANKQAVWAEVHQATVSDEDADMFFGQIDEWWQQHVDDSITKSGIGLPSESQKKFYLEEVDSGTLEAGEAVHLAMGLSYDEYKNLSYNQNKHIVDKLTTAQNIDAPGVNAALKKWDTHVAQFYVDEQKNKLTTPDSDASEMTLGNDMTLKQLKTMLQSPVDGQVYAYSGDGTKRIIAHGDKYFVEINDGGNWVTDPLGKPGGMNNISTITTIKKKSNDFHVPTHLHIEDENSPAFKKPMPTTPKPSAKLADDDIDFYLDEAENGSLLPYEAVAFVKKLSYEDYQDLSETQKLTIESKINAAEVGGFSGASDASGTWWGYKNKEAKELASATTIDTQAMTPAAKSMALKDAETGLIVPVEAVKLAESLNQSEFNDLTHTQKSNITKSLFGADLTKDSKILDKWIDFQHKSTGGGGSSVDVDDTEVVDDDYAWAYSNTLLEPKGYPFTSQSIFDYVPGGINGETISAGKDLDGGQYKASVAVGDDGDPYALITKWNADKQVYEHFGSYYSAGEYASDSKASKLGITWHTGYTPVPLGDTALKSAPMPTPTAVTTPHATATSDVYISPTVVNHFKQTLKANGNTGYWSKPEKIWDAIKEMQSGYLNSDGSPTYSPMQILKALDKTLKTKTPNPFETKMVKWIGTKKGATYAGVDFLDTPTKAPAGSTGLTGPAPTQLLKPGTPKLGGADISAMPQGIKDGIYSKFKTHPNTYLKSPSGSIFSAIESVSKEYNIDPGQALAVIDEVGATKFGVPNEGLFTKKITDWLASPAGAAYLTGMAPGNKPGLPPIPELSPNVKPNTQLPSFEASNKYTYSIISSTTKAMQVWNEMTAKHGEWTPGQEKGLKTWTGGAFMSINSYLYGDSKSISPTNKTAMNNAQKGMRPSLRPMLLKRGIYFNGIAGASNFKELKNMEGQTWLNTAFTATSIGTSPAFSSKPVWMEIEAPPGTPMAWVDHISLNPGEKEMLLAAGLHYKILSVEEKNVPNHGTRTIVRVRVVPKPAEVATA